MQYVDLSDTIASSESFNLEKVPNEIIYFITSMMLPDLSLKLDNEMHEAYKETRCTETAKIQDAQLDTVKQWLHDPHL